MKNTYSKEIAKNPKKYTKKDLIYLIKRLELKNHSLERMLKAVTNT